MVCPLHIYIRCIELQNRTLQKFVWSLATLHRLRLWLVRLTILSTGLPLLVVLVLDLFCF